MMLRTGFSLYAGICLLILHCGSCEQNDSPDLPWRWSCDDNRQCQKIHRNSTISSDLAVSLEVCKMFCGKSGLLWPMPSGKYSLGSLIARVNIARINIKIQNGGKITELLEGAGARFKTIVSKTMPKKAMVQDIGRDLDVYLHVRDTNVKSFSVDMDESYWVNVSLALSNKINATIVGQTFFGVRHGLETLSQLFVYDEREQHPMIVINATIDDSPKYKYRGFMLDTSRNYFPVASIKRTIDTMATVKLNSFHWHIVDQHSFPFVSELRPNMSYYGAYSPTKIYTKEAIRDIVAYALVRGIRVIPELNAPAHTVEGWQGTGLTACLKMEPWELYCDEPPCGQLNPTEEVLYDHLQALYTDLAASFVTTDMFHMGNDGVNERCWRSSKSVDRFMKGNFYFQETSFIEMWSYYLVKAHERVYKGFKYKIPIIIWTSELTDALNVEEYIDKEDYYIQITSNSDSQDKARLMEKGYRVILSYNDQLFLDAGFGDWMGEKKTGRPYITWQQIYEHIPTMGHQFRGYMVLGSEAVLYTEGAHAGNLDSLLWPRLGALAERLWASPATTWRDAQKRMLHLKERLTRLGIHTEALQPEWCYHNEGKCKGYEKKYRLKSAPVSKATRGVKPFLSCATVFINLVSMSLFWFINC